jgi:hypothetical protein
MNRMLPRTSRIPERRAGRLVIAVKRVEKKLGVVMIVPSKVEV